MGHIIICFKTYRYRLTWSIEFPRNASSTDVLPNYLIVLQKLIYYSCFVSYIDFRPRCLIALSLSWRQKSISADDCVVFAEIIYFAFGLRYMLIGLYYCLYCSFSWVSATSESGPLRDILLGRHHYPAKTENTLTRLFRPRILYEGYLLNLTRNLSYLVSDSCYNMFPTKQIH